MKSTCPYCRKETGEYDHIKNHEMAESDTDTDSTTESGPYFGATSLMDAVMDGDVDRVRALVPARIHDTDYNDMSALHYISLQKEDNPEILSILLDAGANINAQDEDGDTLLHGLAGCELPCILQLLLDRGADMNIVNTDGLTPLACAAQDNNVDMLNELLDRGATGLGQALFEACDTEFDQCRNILLKRGADPNYRNEDGLTPLMVAIDNRDWRLACYLMKHGADLHAVDVDGYSGFMRLESASMHVIEMFRLGSKWRRRADGSFERVFGTWKYTSWPPPLDLRRTMDAAASGVQRLWRKHRALKDTAFAKHGKSEDTFT